MSLTDFIKKYKKCLDVDLYEIPLYSDQSYCNKCLINKLNKYEEECSDCEDDDLSSWCQKLEDIFVEKNTVQYWENKVENFINQKSDFPRIITTHNYQSYMKYVKYQNELISENVIDKKIKDTISITFNQGTIILEIEIVLTFLYFQNYDPGDIEIKWSFIGYGNDVSDDDYDNDVLYLEFEKLIKNEKQCKKLGQNNYLWHQLMKNYCIKPSIMKQI